MLNTNDNPIDLRELNLFISTLPQKGISYSVDSLIPDLYRSCRQENLDKSQSDMLLKKAIRAIGKYTNISLSN